jgi:hypothetical protein
MTKRTSIYLNPPIEEALKGADSISGRLGQICDRFAEINRRARIQQRFSAAELNALRDCSNGTWFDPAKLIDGAVLANFEDSAPDGLYAKWGIDGPATADKLRGLSYADQVALVEDIEKFWQAVTPCPVEPEDD